MESLTLREAGPNETRCILRHHLGLYSNIAVGAIYLIPKSLASQKDLQLPSFYAWALKECVSQHPFLRVTIRGGGTNRPVYTKPDQLDLQQHIRMIQEDDLSKYRGDEKKHLAKVFEHLHNSPLLRFSNTDSRPAWAIDIVSLSNAESGGVLHRLFVSFTYSHGHCDGMSGGIFHRTFHTAFSRGLLEQGRLSDMIIKCPATTLPEQPDTASKMPISLSYLLRPALGTYLPKFLSGVLGLSGNVSGSDAQTWVGTKTFTDDRTRGMQVTTSVETCQILPDLLVKLLRLCKEHNIKLTALLNYVIAQAFKATLMDSGVDVRAYTNLASGVPINLRKALKVDENTIGNYGSAAYLRYDLDLLSQSMNQQMWCRLQSQNESLGRTAAAPKDHPIGLLRYVSNFNSWIQGQIGQERDCSWELSNLGSFRPSGEFPTRIEQILFSQSACPYGPLIVFNTISSKYSPLNIVISWQFGALGLLSKESVGSLQEEHDREIVKRLITAINDGLELLVQVP